MGIEELLMDQYEKKGIKKGIKEGIKEGIVLGTKKTALEMKKKGLDISLIAEVTGLSIEEIEKLA